MIYNNRSILKFLICFVALGLLFLLPSYAIEDKSQAEKGTTQLPKSKVVSTIEIPEFYIQGIVMVKDHLWGIDSKRRALLKIDIQTKKIVDSLTTEVRSPRGLAWDGKYFWSADNETKMIHQIDSITGKIIRSLDVPIYGKKESAILEAVTWDGKYLWVAYSAGWSSRIHRMDIETGEIVLSMFADCYPKGLATDGKYLWVMRYNLGKYPGVIDQRTIMDDPGKMTLSRKFLVRTLGKEPTSVTFDGKYLWVADRERKSLQRIELP